MFAKHRAREQGRRSKKKRKGGGEVGRGVVVMVAVSAGQKARY